MTRIAGIDMHSTMIDISASPEKE